MTGIEPAAHGILNRAKRGHDVEAEAKDKAERLDRDAVELFLIRATSDMLRRMRDGLRRGWGSGWRASYADDAVTARLNVAAGELMTVLAHYRAGLVGIDELRKRAADVSNQAFMLADPERLRDAGDRYPEPGVRGAGG